jgi:hypothetical protein
MSFEKKKLKAIFLLKYHQNPRVLKEMEHRKKERKRIEKKRERKRKKKKSSKSLFK